MSRSFLQPVEQPSPNPFGHGPRVFRMTGPMMEPTLRHGDLLIAVPMSRYHCEGLYFLSFGFGHMAVWRCEARQGSIFAWKDSEPAYQLEMTRAEFEDAVLAQVAITGRLVAGGLLPEAGGIIG
jgi:hypothetical protein